MIIWKNSKRYKLLKLHLRYEVDPRYKYLRKAIRDHLNANRTKTI